MLFLSVVVLWFYAPPALIFLCESVSLALGGLATLKLR